jgi:hypothetical protein
MRRLTRLGRREYQRPSLPVAPKLLTWTQGDLYIKMLSTLTALVGMAVRNPWPV